MKMEKYYPVLKSLAEEWFSHQSNRQAWAEYVTQVIKEDEYHALEVRLAWDMGRILTTAGERSGWAHECGANDKHLTTLFIKVGKEVGYFA